MRLNAFAELMMASFAFSAVVLTSMTGRAQDPTPTANWVNIKSPAFGAYGDGKHDDTAAIQAAIDYAFNNNLSAVYCPAGTYKTSNTIWLDPPNNMRATTWTGTGYFTASGNVFTDVSTTSGALAIGDYLYGSNYTSGPVVIAGGSHPNWVINSSFSQGWSGSPVALTASNPSSPSQFQFTIAFFGDPASGSVQLSGCRLTPTFNNAVAFMVGSGQSMRASDFAVVGPNNGYRGNLSPYGIGIGIAGGSGGASGTLIENTLVRYFYVSYETDANGAYGLSDSSTFRKIAGLDGYVGIGLYGTQSYINDIVEPTIGATIAIDSAFAHQVNVFGGNLSSPSAASATFSLTNVSSVFQEGKCVGWCFNATIVSPDEYIGSVYNSYVILTPHYGAIPLQLVSWNPSTNTAEFGMWQPWLYGEYGGTTDASHMNNDLVSGAVNTVYAAERVTVARGMGIQLDGVNVENPQSCTTLFDPYDIWGGDGTSLIRNLLFNYDPSGFNSYFTTAEKYCQQAFPFIGGLKSSYASSNPSLRIIGGSWPAASQPLLIDTPPTLSIYGSQLGNVRFNFRVNDPTSSSYGQLNSTNLLTSAARGAGQWDNDYFTPVGLAFPQPNSDVASIFCGYEPCPWTTPNLSPTLYSLVNGTLGPLGSYPPIACRTVFKSVDWNTGSVTPPSTSGGGIFKRSASCPGYSWGQNLTQATVGSADNADGTGYIDNGRGGAGNILHWTSANGALAAGDTIVQSGGSGVSAGTYIVAQLSGTPGGTGTYLVSESQKAGSSGSSLTLAAPSATWAYTGRSNVLYLDTSTMPWMFPGLGISIDNGSGAHAYTVMAVYPWLGYVTVIGADSNAGTPLQGSDGTVYSCASGCTIDQASYAWTAY